MRPHPGSDFDRGQVERLICRIGPAIIQPMSALRHARFLTRLVLVWFALALGVAIASPLVQPQGIELVCASGGAMKLILKSADGSEASSSHTLDCPLCASVSAPPPVLASVAVASLSGAPVLRPRAVAHRLSRPAAPLPPRGPPAFA